MSRSVKLAAAMLLALAASSTQAGVVTSLGLDTEIFSTLPNTTALYQFNDTLCPYSSCAGSYEIVTGAVPDSAAQPLNSPLNFLAIPSTQDPLSSGSATFTLGFASDYFGLYWGSIDQYNTIEFFLGGVSVAAVSGSDAVGAADADGGQTDYASNRFVNFLFTDGDTFDSFVMTSTQRAFETDNHTFRDVNAVPEPTTMLLMLLGLLGLRTARRRVV